MYYVAIRVPGNKNNEIEKVKFKDIRQAIVLISHYIDEEYDRWRVVEIPDDEPIDYDGTVVAEIQTGRLF
jgi:hypothetical protein